MLVKMSYRQLTGWYNESEIYQKQFLFKSKNKRFYLVGDLKIAMKAYFY